MHTFIFIVFMIFSTTLVSIVLRFFYKKKENESSYNYVIRMKPILNVNLILSFFVLIVGIYKINSKIEITEPTYKAEKKMNPCSVSIDFIKQDLQNPATIDYSMFDCNYQKEYDNTYTVLRKISASNLYGVKKQYVYKLQIEYIGGNEIDESSWNLISIRSEEYK